MMSATLVDNITLESDFDLWSLNDTILGESTLAPAPLSSQPTSVDQCLHSTISTMSTSLTKQY